MQNKKGVFQIVKHTLLVFEIESLETVADTDLPLIRIA